MSMGASDPMQQLEQSIEEITKIARRFGLDFFPMRYEICPADIIYTFGAYGMPTRYSHWSFGKNFHKMKMQYDLGLSKIYELVINSDPCYAFLLEGNSLIQNKLIAAHVLAHSDFFKNNVRFSATNRNMVESMAVNAERIREYEVEYGADAVEQLIDAALSIQEHIDPSLIKPARRTAPPSKRDKRPARRFGYEDLWDLEAKAQQAGSSGNQHATGNLHLPSNSQPQAHPEQHSTRQLSNQDSSGRSPKHKNFPEHPQKDLMQFISEHSNVLEDWQRDILTMLREEMLYFWPQIETKIMNEGWASYWHIRILRELDLTPEETIEYAKLNASVVQPSAHMLNPYYLGLKIFEDIEHRMGHEHIFEVRELDSDSSFLRNYLTKELVEELDLYVFEKQGAEWKITDKRWESIRDQLVFSRVNGGFPYLVVEDGNYDDQGELYLKHRYEGIELDIKYLEKTLPYVQQLWGRRVHLETVIENKLALFSYDGHKHHRKFL